MRQLEELKKEYPNLTIEYRLEEDPIYINQTDGYIYFSEEFNMPCFIQHSDPIQMWSHGPSPTEGTNKERVIRGVFCSLGYDLEFLNKCLDDTVEMLLVVYKTDMKRENGIYTATLVYSLIGRMKTDIKRENFPGVIDMIRITDTIDKRKRLL